METAKRRASIIIYFVQFGFMLTAFIITMTLSKKVDPMKAIKNTIPPWLIVKFKYCWIMFTASSPVKTAKQNPALNFLNNLILDSAALGSMSDINEPMKATAINSDTLLLSAKYNH